MGSHGGRRNRRVTEHTWNIGGRSIRLTLIAKGRRWIWIHRNTKSVMHHSSTEDISISLLLYPFGCSALLVSTESFAFKCHNFPRLFRSMETNLVEENKQLRKRVIELESQVASLQETLDKYKESCRFQVWIDLYHMMVASTIERVQRFTEGTTPRCP